MVKIGLRVGLTAGVGESDGLGEGVRIVCNGDGLELEGRGVTKATIAMEWR